jgi:divalent metal cation (Fe/Co/Zn/Cd) transporter
MKLISAEHPPIGLVRLLGLEFWAGWLMLPALAYSAIPAVVLGRMKLPLSAALHDKVLYADAKMNKADWLTAVAAMVGVVGIGFGMWWADAVAALVISLDIVHDGWRNVSAAVLDLMDRRPTTHDDTQVHPLPAKVKGALEQLDWVHAARVRLREEGHVFTGDALVVPADEHHLVARISDATEKLYALDWRLYDIVIVPVASLDDV